jgi:glycosyltransferase involved in cell wall biosynthesis
VRVDQFVPGFAKYDAIGNHALEVRRAFRRAGYDSDIWGEVIDYRLTREARPYTQCPAAPDPDRLILYHASTHSPMAGWLRAAADRGQKVAIDYHNITPSRYFARWEPPAARSMHVAREQLASLAGFTSLAVADSPFNEAELVHLGFRPTAVCPIVVDLEDYHRPPDGRALARLERRRAAGGHSWLFVGRISPNKCQHDVIAAFAIYRRLFDRDAQLTLVGGPTSPRYLRSLETMVQELELTGCVEIATELAFSDLLAHFRTADVFVCLSEHEGFCVPIIEAMELGLPVVAFSAAAVTDTVADAGVLLTDKDPLVVACAIGDLLGDPERRSGLVASGHARAGDFSLERTSKTMLDIVGGWLVASRA